MEVLINQLTTILLSPAGTITFYIVLTFAAAISLQMIVVNKDTTEVIRIRHLIAIITILSLLLGTFIFSILGVLNWLNPRTCLPLLERIILTVSLLMISWFFSQPRPQKAVDTIAILIAAVLIVLSTFSFRLWIVDSQTYYFNNSYIDWMWSIALLIILLFFIIFLVVKRPNYWVTSGIALLFPFSAITAHVFFYFETGDYSAVVRLAILFSFSILPLMTASLLASQKKVVRGESKYQGISGLNQNLRTLAESNPQVFQLSIPHMMVEIANAEACFLVKDARQPPKITIERCLSNEEGANSPLITLDCEPEDSPNLSHALEGQFILTFDKVAGFRDEFRQLGKRLNLFGAASALVLPFPILPEQKTSMVLIGREKKQWDEIAQAELSSAVNALLLIFHQKQREEQLQRSIQRLLESKQPDFRSIASFNFQELQTEFNALTQQHETLQERYKNLQTDLIQVADNIEEISIRSGARDKFYQTIQILKAWLDQAQTQNSLLRAELDQVLREKQSLVLEIDHFRNANELTSQVVYLQPQESLVLDEKTNINETLARSQELLFRLTEMNHILEQIQVQSVIVLESIQEQMVNLHQFQKPEEETQDGESFLLQAEYFLEDIRTAQSVLKEQSRLQRMLEESFLNSLKMKDHFDHLSQLNHRNYKKINQIYQELEKNRSQSEEATLILSNIQEENEKLRNTMLEAMAKNQGDTLTIENLQTEMLAAFEEISILKDKIEQKQDLIYQYQLEHEMVSDGVKENNQIIISLIQDVLQPISTITGCTNLLSANMPEDATEKKLFDQVYASIRTIQDQVNKLILCTERNSQLLTSPEKIFAVNNSSSRPPSPPEALGSHE